MPIVAYLTTTTTLRGLTGLSSCNNRWWIVIIMRNAVVGHVSEGVVAKSRPKKIGSSKHEISSKILGDERFFDIVPTVSS
jgi:hypothetical protein